MNRQIRFALSATLSATTVLDRHRMARVLCGPTRGGTGASTVASGTPGLIPATGDQRYRPNLVPEFNA